MAPISKSGPGLIELDLRANGIGGAVFTLGAANSKARWAVVCASAIRPASA